MAKHVKDDQPKEQDSVKQGRRDFLKGSGVVAGGLATAAMAGTAAAAATESESKNPYGDRPGGGISLTQSAAIDSVAMGGSK